MRNIYKMLGVVSAVVAMTATGCSKKTYELAVVTDIGSLMDGGFNQGTYEGVKEYGDANGLTYQVYQPENSNNATDNDRIAAFRQAAKNGAKVIVTPGFLQATALRTVGKEYPNIKFIFVDGWNVTDSADENGNDNGTTLNNVTAICYKEEESGFLAGYAAVKDGYTKLGGTFGGGGTNPACCRFAYGYVQGIKAAAIETSTDCVVKISFQHGASFSGSTELQTQMKSWYTGGTQVIFSCGGTMVNSVLAAANEFDEDKAKVIGVDVDQSNLSTRVITSATKGLAVSVKKVLGQIYTGQWDTQLGGKTSNLGINDDATGIPTAAGSWRFNKFTTAEYNTLKDKMKSGQVSIKNDTTGSHEAAFWTTMTDPYTTVQFE